MGLLKTLEQGLAVEKESQIWPHLATYYGPSVAHTSQSRDLVQAYRVHPWIYAGLDAIGKAAASVPLVALKMKQRPTRTIKAFKAQERLGWEKLLEKYAEDEGAELVDHPALGLLYKPLPGENVTSHDLLYAVVIYLGTDGNAFIEKCYPSENAKEPNGLWPFIDPRSVYVMPGEERLVKGYVWRKSTGYVAFEADQFIHFKTFNPENPYYGLSPTEVLKQSLIADVRAMDWNRMFFENSAIPSGYLTTEKHLEKPNAKMIRELWEEQHMGRQRSHRTAVLADGTKYEYLDRSHKDMEFLSLREWTRDEVLAVLGVPPILVGLREGANKAISQTERRMFWENTVLPWCDKIEAVLDHALVPEENIRLMFDVSAIEALQEDVERKARIWRIRKDLPNKIDEIRVAWDQEPIGGVLGETVLIPRTFVAMDPQGNTVDLMDNSGNEVRTLGTGRRVVKDVADDIGALMPPPETAVLEEVCEEYMPDIAVSGAGRGVDIVTGLGVTVPPDWEQVFNFQDEIQRWLDSELGERVADMDGWTRTRGARVIREGIDQGKGARAIAADLRREFRDMSRTRALTIARTEGGKAVSFGQHKLYSDVKVEQHWWQATLFHTRTSHIRAHDAYSKGNAIPIDDPFEFMGMDGGTVATLAPRMTGIGAEDINCYCEEIPHMPGRKGFTTYKALGVLGFEDWMKGLEQGDEFKRFQGALAAYFEHEAERYVEHLMQIYG